MRNIKLLKSFGALLDNIEEFYEQQVLKAKKSLPDTLNFMFNDKKYSIYVLYLRDFYLKLLSDYDVSIDEISFFQFADSSPSENEYHQVLFEINKLDEVLLTSDEVELRYLLNQIEKQLSSIDETYRTFRSSEDYEFGQKYDDEMLRIFTEDDELTHMLEMYENEELNDKIEANRYNTGDNQDDDEQA